MEKKHIIKLAHPIREMLSTIVIGLKDFELASDSLSLIVMNRKDKDVRKNKQSIVSRVLSEISRVIVLIQKNIGLINFKFSVKNNSDILVAHGGFLVTDKPYITYIEKATQIYGYTAKNYNKWLSRFLMKFFLKSNKLKKIFFLSEAAFKGMIGIEDFDHEMRELIISKGIVVYPPIDRVGKSDLARFKNIKDGVRFLYISNNFYGKGGLEVLHAFSKLKLEIKNIRLIIVTDINSIEVEDYKDILNTNGVELYDFIFMKDELFDRFIDQCHVFCYPTYSDSFSAVVNEVISSYLPVIATDFYAIPERVKNGYNGFLCKSPFPNYDENFVIHSEHFTDQPYFYEKIRNVRKNGGLQYIEDFLFEKMKLLVMDNTMLYQMALNNMEFCREHLDSNAIKNRINSLFTESIKM